MFNGIIQNIKNNLFDAIYYLKRNLWVAISYVATFLLGIILGIIFSNASTLIFFNNSINWFIDLFYMGNFFGALWRFLLTLVVFSVIFILLSQNKFTFWLGYLLILIRGIAFLCSVKVLLSTFSIIAILFVILIFSLQQLALLLVIAIISSYYYCNNICIKHNSKDFIIFLAFLCVILALAECILIFVILKPILLSC